MGMHMHMHVYVYMSMHIQIHVVSANTVLGITHVCIRVYVDVDRP